MSSATIRFSFAVVLPKACAGLCAWVQNGTARISTDSKRTTSLVTVDDETATKALVVGRPFERGNQIGKKGGRPKSLATRLKMATRSGRDVVETVDKIMMGEIDAPAAVRLDAAKWIGERIWGKAPDLTVNLNADATETILGQLDRQELRAFFEGVSALRNQRLAAQSAANQTIDAPKVPDPQADTE